MADEIDTQQTETPTAIAPSEQAPAAQPSVEADDFDDLLSEFRDAPTAPTPAQPPAAPAVRPDATNLELLNIVSNIEARHRQERDTADTLSAIKTIRGEIAPAVYSDAMIATWISGISQSEPQVQEAWEKRFTDPKGYERAVTKLAQRFAKEHGKLPDPHATEDRELVSASMRAGAGKAPPPETDASYGRRVARMSDAELRQEWERLGIDR